MPNENPKKTPSADEIIEALALEMGVDEAAAGPKRTAQPTPPPPPQVPPRPPKALAAHGDRDAPPPVPVARSEKATVPMTAKARGQIPTTRSDSTLEAAGIGEIFLLADPGDPVTPEGAPMDLDDDAELGELRSTRLSSRTMRVLIVLLITAIGLAVAYFLVPGDKRQDVWPLLRGEDIQTQRQERRRQEAERIRREWLAAQPKYGRLSVATRPSYGLIRVDGASDYVQHPARAGTLVETRSPMAFENLDVREHHVIYITLPNYQERRIELFPYEHEATRWFQDQDTGHYYLEANEILEPLPEVATELLARLNPSSMIPELPGEITVRTEPPGAMVYYNNTLVTDAEGIPLLTPVTFLDYPPRPETMLMPEQQPPVEPEQATGEPAAPQLPLRRPVTLSFRGVPLRVEMEGYLAVATGIYSHMYACQPVEGVAEEAPFWEKCRYTYDTGVLYLLTPEEFAPAPEPPAEGTGQAAAPVGP